MEHIKVFLYCFIITFLLAACSKEKREEVKELVDTASHKLGRELDTLVNTTLKNDSLYEQAPLVKADTTALAREEFRDKLNDIFDEYSDIKDELADDDSTAVVKQSEEFSQALMKVQTESASEKLGSQWRLWVSSVETINSDFKAAKTLEGQRKVFSDLSSVMETMIQKFGLKDKTVYKISCPKAKQKNYFWLTDSKDNLNPYYGKDKSNQKSEPCIEIIKAYQFP